MKKSSLIITEQLLQIMKKPREERLTIDNDCLSLHLMQYHFSPVYLIQTNMA